MIDSIDPVVNPINADYHSRTFVMNFIAVGLSTASARTHSIEFPLKRYTARVCVRFGENALN